MTAMLRGFAVITIPPSGSRRVLLPVLVQKPLTVRGHIPRVWPEAQVHTPPVVRYAAVDQLGDELVEVQLALAEGSVGAGVVLVERAVRIDEVQMCNLALEFGEQ